MSLREAVQPLLQCQGHFTDIGSLWCLWSAVLSIECLELEFSLRVESDVNFIGEVGQSIYIYRRRRTRHGFTNFSTNLPLRLRVVNIFESKDSKNNDIFSYRHAKSDAPCDVYVKTTSKDFPASPSAMQ